jgi:hypothetical protein
MPSIPELTRAYLAAHKAKADAEAASKAAGRAKQAAEAKLAEAMMDEGLTRMAVDGRMVGLNPDYLEATVDTSVSSAEFEQSMIELGLGEILQRNTVTVHPQTLSAELRRMRDDLAEEGKELPKIRGVKWSTRKKFTNAKGSS